MNQPTHLFILTDYIIIVTQLTLVIVRCLTEWTATNQQGTFDQTSISEGIGGVTIGPDQTECIGIG